MKTRVVVISLVAVMVVALLTSCASKPASPAQSARQEAIDRALPIRASESIRPDWINNPLQDRDYQFFVGISRRQSTEADGRNEARENARVQLVDFYGTLMVNRGKEAQARFGIANEVFAPQIVEQQFRERMSQGLSQALGDSRSYWEYFLDEYNREYYIIWQEAQIEKTRVARMIDDFGKEQAADYLRRAAAEQDAARRQQLEKASDYFGGNFSSMMGF